MKLIFLHGWQSFPGGVEPTYLAQHGHEVINPKPDDDDFDAAESLIALSGEKTMTQNACPECGAAMEEGFIPDMAHGNAMQLAWQRGIPENKKFLGLKTRAVKFNESECVKITARRCTKCGLLKLYARPTSE